MSNLKEYNINLAVYIEDLMSIELYRIQKYRGKWGAYKTIHSISRDPLVVNFLCTDPHWFRIKEQAVTYNYASFADRNQINLQSAKPCI